MHQRKGPRAVRGATGAPGEALWFEENAFTVGPERSPARDVGGVVDLAAELADPRGNNSSGSCLGPGRSLATRSGGLASFPGAARRSLAAEGEGADVVSRLGFSPRLLLYTDPPELEVERIASPELDCAGRYVQGASPPRNHPSRPSSTQDVCVSVEAARALVSGPLAGPCSRKAHTASVSSHLGASARPDVDTRLSSDHRFSYRHGRPTTASLDAVFGSSALRLLVPAKGAQPDGVQKGREVATEGKHGFAPLRPSSPEMIEFLPRRLLAPKGRATETPRPGISAAQSSDQELLARIADIPLDYDIF